MTGQATTRPKPGGSDSFSDAATRLWSSLSSRRANAVVAWLVNSLHISTDRMRAVGMGKTHPLVNPFGTKEEQALNRRVEIKVRPLR